VEEQEKVKAKKADGDDEDQEAAPEAAEASLDEILAKKEEDAAPGEEADEEAATLVPTGREERVEPLAVKVVPQQPTEFTCKKCFLVKHRSQLADKKRMICRDCA
jgi:hypothetical protein